VKICVDFYSESEIINAGSAVDSMGVRLPKRNRSSDRLRLTMEDIVKCVLDPSVQLPEFLARLPPVDVSHCDVSAILLELRALRAEVRSMGQIAATVETIDLSACETLVRIVAGTHPWLVCRIMGAIV